MFRKRLTSDFVELSVGRVYFKEITHGLLNKITRKSTIIGNTLNSALFLEMFEYALVDLSNRKIRQLNLIDGDKLRSKIKEILLRHNIINPEVKQVQEEKPKPSIFSHQDVEWFEKSKNQSINRIK